MTTSRSRDKFPTLDSGATFHRAATTRTTPDAVPDPEVTSHGPTLPAAPPSVANTYRLRPDVRFRHSTVRKITSSLLEQKLRDVTYEPYLCKSLGQELAAEIMEKIKDLNIKRYKVVAVVSIGSNKERSGVQFGSRCLWDKETDTFITVKFSNQTLFAVAMVYGLYYE